MARATVLTLACLLATGCTGSGEPAGGGEGRAGRPLFDDIVEVTDLAERPRGPASEAFWERWGDGRAEISTYRLTTRRYGERREGEAVLVFVTEPHDRTRWIKDGDAPEARRVNVMKLNIVREFLTGIYPYSVMTSVFAPVADWGRRRFSPVKLSLAAQEWCGNYFHQIWAGESGYRSLRLSYFADDGERVREVEREDEILYEDALLIQLRELDAPFADGRAWSGWIVPGLWRIRARGAPPEPVRAEVTRRPVEGPDGRPATRFVLEYGDYRRTVDVEWPPPRRILGWATSEGDTATLVASERLAYWKLNSPRGRKHRRRLGLAPDATGVPPAVPSASRLPTAGKGEGGC